MPPKVTNIHAYLAERSAPAGECIVWTGALNEHGYGRAVVQQSRWRAHRLAWVVVNGPIPEGMSVCHRCDNPPCINVDHLFLGTQADNLADMARKGRGRRPSGFRETGT